MAKFSERRRYVSRVIQPSTRSTLGEYDSRPPLARYVWYFTSYLRSSCCSETHVRPRLLPVFLPLSILDVTHVRRCTRPSPLYRTKQRRKAGRGTGNEAMQTGHWWKRILLCAKLMANYFHFYNYLECNF